MTDAPARTVEVFAEVSCPFAHVGLRRFVEARDRAGAGHVDLRVRAWPLELLNGEPLAAGKVGEEIEDLRAQVAPDLFAGFDPAVFPGSTLGPLGLTVAAGRRDASTAEGVALDLRTALFEQGRPVSDPGVLAEVAAAHDLEVPDAHDARALAEADLEEGRRRGVVGSPHFFLDDGSFFCPGLEIERQGGHLHIEVTAGPFREFLDRAFA